MVLAAVPAYKYGHEGMSDEDLGILWIAQGAPSDFQDLVSSWSSRVEMIAKKYGFRGEDLEDIKSLIFEQFYTGKYFEIYDPRKAKFSTFMYNFITKRVLQQVSKRTRDPLHGSVPLAIGPVQDPGEIIIDLVQLAAPRMEDKVESTEVIQEIRRALGALPQRGKRNLLALFDMMILDWPRSAMAQMLGVSEATVCLMIKDLRDTSAIQLLKWS